MKIMTKIGACLIALCALPGCFPEKSNTASTQVKSVAPISVAEKSSASWVPAAEMTSSEISRVDDILATNNMVVLDMSGSMEDNSCSGNFSTRSDAAKDALFKWISANAGGNIGLVAFNSGEPELLHGLGSGDAHGRKIIETIRAIQPEGGTPLSTAIEMAEAELRAQFIRQNGSGTYRMIVITDGEASKGYDPTSTIRRIASDATNPIELHTIGFCINGRHSLKDPNAVFYVDATSPEDIVKGLNATQGEGASFSTDDLNFEELTQ